MSNTPYFLNAKRNGDHQIIVSLNNRIKEVTQITTDANPIEFVDRIMKDYNYYTQQL